ncbi:hypothetical protein ACF0H5_002870 [Mactra antiquata]
MMVKNTTENIVRCSIVGDGLVGKTSLVKKFVHNKYTDSYVATVFDNFAGHVAVAGDKYTVSVFDTAGQRDYEGLRVFTYAQSDVVIVCYSAVDRDSYDNITEFWIPEIRNYIKKTIPIILVATQTDLCTNNNDSVTAQDGEILAGKIGASMFLELSVHDVNGVECLFTNVVMNALKKRKRKISLLGKILRR